MESVTDFSADDIATNPISDAGSTDSIPFPVSPFLHEEWLRSWTSNIPEDSHTPQVNAEASSLIICGVIALHLLTQRFRWSCPSIQRVLVWSGDGGAETSHPENLITGIHDEGRPVIRLSGSIYQTTFPWFFPVCRLSLDMHEHSDLT